MILAKNNRFYKIFRSTIRVDLSNLSTLIDHVEKKNLLNRCFFVAFDGKIGLVFQFFCKTMLIHIFTKANESIDDLLTKNCFSMINVCTERVDGK